MRDFLREKITFANFNLVFDNAFGEMNLVFCRNVLIYFNNKLQNRVIRLFADSLVNGCFLCLGSKETIDFTDSRSCFENFDEKARIYKRKMV